MSYPPDDLLPLAVAHGRTASVVLDGFSAQQIGVLSRQLGGHVVILLTGQPDLESDLTASRKPRIKLSRH